MFRSATAFSTLLWAAASIVLTTTPATADEPVGEVTAVVGSAVAERADGTTRPLTCGDSVFAGERVVTPENGGVGLLSGDAYAHLAGASSLHVGRTERGEARLDLQAGRVRVVDVRDAGAPVAVAALGANAELVGNDTEAYVLAEKVERYAMLCEYDAPLAVTRDGQRVDAGPGDCVIAKSREPLYTARAHADRIPLAGLDACELPIVTLGPVGERFSTASVAAPPIVAAVFPGPAGVLPSPLDACEDPGTGCGATAAAGLGLGTNPFEPVLPPGAGGDLGLGTQPFEPILPPGVTLD